MKLIKYILIFSVPAFVLGYSFVFSQGFSKMATAVDSNVVSQNNDPLQQADIKPTQSLDHKVSLSSSQFANVDKETISQANADFTKQLYSRLKSGTGLPIEAKIVKDSPAVVVHVINPPSVSSSDSSDSGSSAPSGGFSASGSGSSASGGGSASSGSGSSGSGSSGGSSSGSGSSFLKPDEDGSNIPDPVIIPTDLDQVIPVDTDEGSSEIPDPVIVPIDPDPVVPADPGEDGSEIPDPVIVPIDPDPVVPADPDEDGSEIPDPVIVPIDPDPVAPADPDEAGSEIPDPTIIPIDPDPVVPADPDDDGSEIPDPVIVPIDPDPVVPVDPDEGGSEVPDPIVVPTDPDPDPIVSEDPEEGNTPVIPDEGNEPDISYNIVDTNQISQFGITWTFDKDYQTGQFANGDYWVVGPVKIVMIDPPSTETDGRIINGSMINPSPKNGNKQGYDNSMYGNPSLYEALYNTGRPNGNNLSSNNPLVIQPGSSLVSSVSHPESGKRPQLKTAAILTVLAETAPVGSFRPAYCGSDKVIKFNKSQLDYSRLKSLQPVATAPALAVVERYFERPWIDHIGGYEASQCNPSENMPVYGRDMSNQIGIGALVLNLNFSNQQKEKLLCSYVQIGIDFYGIVKDSGEKNWACDGGVASGRKFPILFAGVMLNNIDMKKIGEKSGDYAYSPKPGGGYYDSGDLPPDYIHFGEDDQTFYVSDNDIYEEPYQEQNYHGFIYYGHGNGAKKHDYIEYQDQHRGLPEWGIRHVTNRDLDGLDWDASYRRDCTANSWAGFILASHIMDMKELWNHGPLFDYMDRYMQIELGLGTQGTYLRQWSKFSGDMWDYYRPQYASVWSESNVE